MLQIIKNGTACHFKGNEINYKSLERLAKEIEVMKDTENIDTLIVASGSIKLGMLQEKETRIKDELTAYEKQGYASVGQPILMELYREIFSKNVAQILPTREDLEKRDYVSRLVEHNLKNNRISVINYDDCLDFEQINKDNDTLASSLAVYTQADRLIILGDYDGMRNPKGDLINTIEEITDEHLNYCHGKGECGNGGFNTKLFAAKEVTKSNIEMYIGNINHKLKEVIQGPTHTRFLPRNYNEVFNI
ncbi:MAG: hypothetical protein ACQESF_06440 [Nanobdellota archaeon]